MNNNQVTQTNAPKLICPNCQSHNINFQLLNQSYLVNKRHGCLWWLLIGWWWIFVKWLIFTIPALLVAIFFGKRKKIVNKVYKVAVCQNCGNSWKMP